jgi:hypothetical protein
VTWRAATDRSLTVFPGWMLDRIELLANPATIYSR